MASTSELDQTRPELDQALQLYEELLLGEFEKFGVTTCMLCGDAVTKNELEVRTHLALIHFSGYVKFRCKICRTGWGDRKLSTVGYECCFRCRPPYTVEKLDSLGLADEDECAQNVIDGWTEAMLNDDLWPEGKTASYIDQLMEKCEEDDAFKKALVSCHLPNDREDDVISPKNDLLYRRWQDDLDDLLLSAKSANNGQALLKCEKCQKPIDTVTQAFEHLESSCVGSKTQTTLIPKKIKKLAADSAQIKECGQIFRKAGLNEIIAGREFLKKNWNCLPEYLANLWVSD